MSDLVFYGLKNCDTCRKARKWLDANGVVYRYHDVRDDGLTREDVTAWLDAYDWQTVINRRSTTWRSLSEREREQMDASRAVDALLSNPTLAKRPILQGDGFLEIGFGTKRYEQLLSRSGQ